MFKAACVKVSLDVPVVGVSCEQGMSLCLLRNRLHVHFHVVLNTRVAMKKDCPYCDLKISEVLISDISAT